jgi:hypothetical protein
MSLETGFLMFSVQPSAKFERSAKLLKKSFKSKRQEQAFVECVTAIVRSLVQEPRDPDSRLEPMITLLWIYTHEEFKGRPLIRI